MWDSKNVFIFQIGAKSRKILLPPELDILDCTHYSFYQSHKFLPVSLVPTVSLIPTVLLVTAVSLVTTFSLIPTVSQVPTVPLVTTFSLARV